MRRRAECLILVKLHTADLYAQTHLMRICRLIGKQKGNNNHHFFATSHSNIQTSTSVPSEFTDDIYNLNFFLRAHKGPIKFPEFSST